MLFDKDPDELLNEVVDTKWYDSTNFFGNPCKEFYEVEERTTFGLWVDSLPGIVALVFLFFYHVIGWPVWFIGFIVEGFIAFVYRLFTKPWKDV